MRRWILRLLLWPLAFVGALIVCAFFLIQLESVQQVVAKRVLKIVNNQITGSIEIDRIGLLLDGRVSVNNFVLRDEHGVEILSADRVRAWIAPWDVLLARIHLLNASVQSLRGNVIVDVSGNNIVSAFASPRPAKADTVKTPLWVRLDRVTVEIESLAVTMDTSFHHVALDWEISADVLLTDSVITYDGSAIGPERFTLQSEGVVRPYSDSLFAGDAELEFNSQYAASDWIADFPDLGQVKLFAQGDVLRRDLAAIFRLELERVGKLNGDIELLDYVEEPRASLGAQFTDLDLSYWIGDSIPHRFTGRAALTKSRSAEWTHDWLARIELDSSYFGEIELAADFEAELYDSTAFLAGAVNTNAGNFKLRVNSHGLTPESIFIFGTAELDQANLHALVPAIPDSLSPLSGSTEFNLEQRPGQELAIDAKLALGALSFGPYALDSLTLHATVLGNTFTLDSTRIKFGSASALLFANGDYTTAITTTVIADVPSIQDFRDLLIPFAPEFDSLDGDVRGELAADLSIAGDSLSDISATGTLQSNSITFGEYEAFGVEFELENLSTNAETIAATVTADSLHAFNETVTPLTLTLNGPWSAPAFTGELSARVDTLHISASGTFDYSNSPMLLVLDSLSLGLFGSDWKNDYPIELSFDSSHYEVAALVMRSDYGVLRSTGYIENPGNQDLVLEFSGLRTGKLAPILRTEIPDGNLNVRVQISGPDTAMTGDIDLRIDSLSYQGDVLSDRIVLNAALTDAKSMTASVYYIWHADTALVASASVPASMSIQNGIVIPDADSLSGKLEVDSLPLSRFAPWLAVGTGLDGYLTSDLELSGSVRRPDWAGTIQLHDGFYRDARYGIAYKWIVLDAVLERDSLLIKTFRATSRGTLTGSGSAKLGVPWPEELNLNLKFDKFEAVSSRLQKARLDGEILVSGPFDSLNATGALTIEEGLYRITQSATKSIEPINMDSVIAVLKGDTLEEGFNPDAFYQSMAHDLRISIPGNFWIRGSGVNTELAGNLRLEKDHNQDPTANGEITIRKGTVKFYGQELRIQDNSTLRFDGPVGEPELNITATYSGVEKVRGQFDVSVKLTGTPDKSAAEFSGKFSDGTVMSEDEAIQRLLPFIGNTGGTPEQAVTEAASGQVSDIVGKASGLDVFEFRPGEDGLSDLSSGQLEIGTYVTDRLFIRVYQPVDEIRAGQKVSVDYRLLDWMKFTAEQTSAKKEESGTSFTIYMQFEWR